MCILIEKVLACLENGTRGCAVCVLYSVLWLLAIVQVFDEALSRDGHNRAKEWNDSVRNSIRY